MYNGYFETIVRSSNGEISAFTNHIQLHCKSTLRCVNTLA